jgi:subfamily B ATP-binding cassette protein MsbA
MADKENMQTANTDKFILKDRHRRLIDMVKANWVRLALSMGCMLIMAGATSATAFLVKPVIDSIFLSKDMAMLKLLPLAVFVVYLVNGLCRYGV